MKKIVVAFVLLTINLNVFCQISSFKIDSFKEYENNTRTSYLTLDQKVSEDFVDFISEEMMTNPSVKLFSFYNKYDFSKCMFTSDLSIDADMIVQMINDIVNNPLMLVTDRFAKTRVVENGIEIDFRIVGVVDETQLDEIEIDLNNDNLILSSYISSINTCKIVVSEEITPQYLQAILDKYNLKLHKDYISKN